MSAVLEELHVRDLALIEDVWLEFAPGMTVLTGETGAGKTALVGALKLLLGERADSTLVRAGANETVVEGRFRVEGDEVLVRRRVSVDGRSRCAIDEELATVTGLASTLGPLVDLHGQHEHQALLSPATHVRYLDRYAGASVLIALDAYREALSGYQRAVRALTELDSALADSERQADYLRFVAEEIESAHVVAGEDEELERRLPLLRHAERLVAAARSAFSLLRADGGGSDSLSRAVASLEQVGGLDPALDDLATRLKAIEVSLEDVVSETRRYAEGVEHDPRVLDEVQERLAALAALKRKYGPALEDVVRTHSEALERLATLDAGEQAREVAAEAVRAADASLRERAHALDTARRAAAPEFEAALACAVSDLGMQGARFEVAFSDVPFEGWTADGPCRTEFLYGPAPGEPARALARIASGGEISRVMLALKSVLGVADATPILVFDEIDAGIGGATASAVGRRLGEISRSHQVIAITHLAQVAVHADRHLLVSRSTDGDRAATSVVGVEDEERVAEIARMLSGADSATSREHARELLAAARFEGGALRT